MTESRKCFVGEEVIEYDLIRRKMKSIRLRIIGDGRLVISCPMRASIYEVEKAIIKNRDWIVNTRFRVCQQLPKNEKREYYTGEKFLYLGVERTLLALPAQKENVQLKGDYIFLNVHSIDDIERKKKMLDKWYAEQTQIIFKQRFYAQIQKFRALFPDEYFLKIRSMTARWGSCMINRNTVILNSKLIYADESLIDYVILHELTHFKYKNHDKDFYSLLTYLCPDWREKKKLLTNKYIYYTR